MLAYMKPVVLMVALNTMAALATKCPDGLYKKLQKDCYGAPYCCEDHLRCFKKDAHAAYCVEKCDKYNLYGDTPHWDCKDLTKHYPYIPHTPEPTVEPTPEPTVTPTKKECPYDKLIKAHGECTHSPHCCDYNPYTQLKCYRRSIYEGAFCEEKCDKKDGWDCEELYPYY